MSRAARLHAGRFDSLSLWERVGVRAGGAPIEPAPHPSPLPKGAREKQP